MTPLLYAIENADAEMVQILLEKGAETEYTTPTAYLPLFYAEMLGNDIIVHTLLRAGTRVDITSSSYRTALSHAAEHGHGAVVRVLVENGPALIIRICLSVCHFHMQLNMDITMCTTLIGHGATVDHPDLSFRVPLSYAAEHGHLHVAQLLLDNGPPLTFQICLPVCHFHMQLNVDIIMWCSSYWKMRLFVTFR